MLADLRVSLGIVDVADSEVQDLIDFARESVVPFATSEWLTRAPTFVESLEETVRGLRPGETLGEVFAAMSSAAPRVTISEPLPVDPMSSASSPADPPPPSPSSGGSGSPYLNLDLGLATRPIRGLPRSPSVAPSSVVITPPVVLPSPSQPLPAIAAASPASGSRPSSSAAAASSSSSHPLTRSSRKRYAAEDSEDKWSACADCSRQKKKCVPATSVNPLDYPCTACTRKKIECVRPEPVTYIEDSDGSSSGKSRSVIPSEILLILLLSF